MTLVAVPERMWVLLREFYRRAEIRHHVGANQSRIGAVGLRRAPFPVLSGLQNPSRITDE